MNKKYYEVAIVGGCLSSQGGGVPRSISHQALALQDMGHHVTLFAGHNKHYPFTPKELGIEPCQIYVSRLWGPSVLGLFPSALLALWKRASSFDVIHLNGGWNLTTFIGGLIARSRRIPYIISCRSHYGDYHFSRMPLLKKLLFQFFEKSSIRHAYAVHITADWERETSWRAIQISKRVIKIPNPVDLSDFKNPPTRSHARRELGLASDRFYMVHLGRTGAQKNLSLLFEAIHAAPLSEKSRLLLIGPPEKAEKRKLKQLAATLGIADQVQFIDFAGGRERCLWLAAADLFILPSHDENFCIATIEAAASGTFSLLSPQVGAVEYMPDELVHVLPNQVSTWANELKKQEQSPRTQTLGNPSWLDPFSQESITAQWIEIYAQLKTDTDR